MNKKWIVIVAAVTCVLFTQGCFLTSWWNTAGFLNGQIVVAKSDTILWQCPGGEGAGNDDLNCVEQFNLGNVPAGTEMVTVANEYGDYAKFGYLRITVVLTYCPDWANGLCATGPVVGWVNGAAVKIK